MVVVRREMLVDCNFAVFLAAPVHHNTLLHIVALVFPEQLARLDLLNGY